MIQWLSRLFNIRPTEWSRLLLICLMISITNMGAIWGSTIAYAAFLKQQGGVETLLPWVFVLSSALSILANAIYSAFVDRIVNDKLMLILYLIGIACITIGLGMIWAGQNQIAYSLLYLLFLAWAAVFNPHFTTYVSGFYDIQSAKQTLPIISAGSLIGAIVAGLTLTIPGFTVVLNPATITLIWLLTYIIGMGLTWAIMRFHQDSKKRGEQINISPVNQARAQKQRISYLDNIQEGLRYIAQSPYLRWMAVSTLLLVTLITLVEYRSISVLSDIYGTQEELARFLALLVGVGNIVVLPMLLFGISRIINRLGLGNASLIFPTGNLLACIGLVFLPGQAKGIIAAAGHLDRTAFRTVFHYPIDSLLYNALPIRIKGRARALISGLIVPTGSLIGGILLLLPQESRTWLVPTLIGVMAIAFLFAAIVIRQHYSKALVKMLEEEDYSFLLTHEVSDLPMADPATLRRLQEKLEESKSHELTIFMTKLIAQIAGGQAITMVAPVIKAAKEGRTRATMVDILVAANLRGDKFNELYTELLADPDELVRQSAIGGLEQLAAPANQLFRSKMLDMLDDPHHLVRARALLALVYSTGNFYQVPQAIETLQQFLKSENHEHRTLGISVLGKIRDIRAIKSLVDYLSDPVDQVRLEAATSLEELSRSSDRKIIDKSTKELIVEKLCDQRQDPVIRIRQAAYTTIGQLGAQDSLQVLADALAETNPLVRTTIVDAIVQVGKSIIPLIHPKIESKDPQIRKMASVILSRINPKEFGSLIVGRSITDNLQTVYRNYGLAEALNPYSNVRSVTIMQSALREQSLQFANEILYLLSAIYDSSAVKIIGDSLRSESFNVRANATEALEALTTPQVAKLIAPLFKPEQQAPHLLSIGKDAWDMDYPNTKDAIRQLATYPDNSWFRAITAYTLGELGAAIIGTKTLDGQEFSKREGEQTQLENQPRIKRRPSSLDLLSAIEDTPGETPKPNLASTYSDPLPNEDSSASNLQTLFALNELDHLIEVALADPSEEVRLAAQTAKQILSGGGKITPRKEALMLSTIDRIIFLKEVPFFQDMTIDQLKVLANVCEERLFDKEMRIFSKGDPGGVLFVVVSGRVGIEQEKRPGSFARLADIEAHSYFGEANFFDNSPHSTNAIAIQDTLILQLRREPLIALARQNPEMSLELINVLSHRLRDANDRIADLTRSRPRELHKLFDQYD